MKNIFSLALALTVTVSAFAQAPQGFNYQAVVLNSSSGALSNQTVSLQLSILDSSASGVAVYVETQSPTTDTTGLFSVVIGNGTVVTGNFSTINWGKNNKFLKTEIDTAGGSNYVLMGISQMMSVPYALFANKSKPDYVTVNTPDGMSNMTAVLIDTIPYTIPTGKNLYTPFYYSNILFGMDTLLAYSSQSTYFGFSEGQTISRFYTPGLTSMGNFPIQGYLVEKTVDWVTYDLVLNPITVPSGKIFVMVYFSSNPNSFYDTNSGTWYWPDVLLDGQIFQNNLYYGVILLPGQTLSAQLTGYPGQLIVNGYFRDE